MYIFGFISRFSEFRYAKNLYSVNKFWTEVTLNGMGQNILLLNFSADM